MVVVVVVMISGLLVFDNKYAQIRFTYPLGHATLAPISSSVCQFKKFERHPAPSQPPPHHPRLFSTLWQRIAEGIAQEVTSDMDWGGARVLR